MRNIAKYLYISVFLVIFSCDILAENNQRNLTKIKKAIVTIDSRISLSAYGREGNWSGTGFVVDIEEGLVVTNSHVSGTGTIGTYFVTFENGQQAEAKLVYYDSFADVAVLKILTEDMPSDVTVIEFSDKSPKIGDEVFVISNADGQGFSFHKGHIGDLCSIDGDMPQASYIINMNVTGGASGSPILNSENKAIGILYGGGKTYSIAAKSFYVQHILNSLLKHKKIPTRNHVGIISKLTSLDKAHKHQKFPKNVMSEYIKKFPDARNRVVSVKTLLNGSPATDVLLPGDIIWKVNGVDVSADLSVVDDQMNKSPTEALFSIYRDGKFLEKTVKTYDLNKNQVTKILDFAGALFFQVDEILSKKSGLPLGSVVIVNVKAGSSFSTIPEMYIDNNKSHYRIKIDKIEGYEIKSLDSVMKIINKLISKRYISVDYTNYLPYEPSFGAYFVTSQEKLRQDIMFDSIDNKPRILLFDSNKNSWQEDYFTAQ